MANTTSLPKNMLIDDFPEELRLEVAKQIALEENNATTYPSEMAGQVIRNNNNNDTNNSLVFVSRHPILESHREIRHSYQNALRSLVLDAQIPRVIMHVLNFDFAPLINEYFNKLTPHARAPGVIFAQYLEIRFTFNSDFIVDRGDESNIAPELRNPDCYVEVPQKVRTDLQAWSDFLTQERAAGRPHNISRYQYTRIGKTIKNDEWFETIRNALFYLNERGDATGEILRILRQAVPYFKGCYHWFATSEWAFRQPNHPTHEAPGEMG